MKDKWLVLLLMLVSVPIAGELNFYPFQNHFRVSLGTPVFFLFLLWIRPVPPFVSGVLAGVSVAVFRMGLELVLGSGWNWEAAFLHHYPVFFYYLVYGTVFAAFRTNRHHDKPLLLGLQGIVIEIAATAAELLMRSSAAERLSSFAIWSQIVLIAFFRSFFVIGFFNLIKLRQAQAAEEQQRKEKEKMLLLISGLYEESVQLQKTLHNAENITKESYDLYQLLKDNQPAFHENAAQKALRIAGQVHEVKKDNQRIYAGLSGLITNESDYMRLDELAGIALRSNDKYARLLGKKIVFRLQAEGELPLCRTYATLSLLNNLAANAVEAIPETGEILIEVKRDRDTVLLRVTDNGPGIAPKHRENIFIPGFTTKFDEAGNSSTGIGLSYVKQEVERMAGTVRAEPGRGGTGAVFTIELPIGQIGKEE
ncbi:sensor histidine kinase [Paenibacillus hamazuiensis]|uniref:sensor histidine kinase n=1 Tax=Paenibacillus hamazuiensis TaxID=2936508 RepID=UPI00200C1D15|nr:sensor histidine kinase [Paenibacillus hamazuiensis]